MPIFKKSVHVLGESPFSRSPPWPLAVARRQRATASARRQQQLEPEGAATSNVHYTAEAEGEATIKPGSDVPSRR